MISDYETHDAADDQNVEHARLVQESVSDLDPTRTMYAGLQDAYDHMNKQLFEPTFGLLLPNCLITLRATGRTHGYFSEDRFVGYNGALTHEIALNPASFACHSVEVSLSILAHQMCHLLQLIDGSAGRATYHNKEFAERMEAIGLITSDTGRPGGKRTAQQMSQYIAPDGKFIQAMRDLLAGGYRARWADRFTGALLDEWDPDHPPLEPAGARRIDPDALGQADLYDQSNIHAQGRAGADLQPETPTPAADYDSGELPPLPMTTHGAEDHAVDAAAMNRAMAGLSSVPEKRSDAGEESAPDAGDTAPAPQHKPLEQSLASKHQDVFVRGSKTKGNTRHKYVCPKCESAVWGKPKLHVVCGLCDETFEDKG